MGQRLTLAVQGKMDVVKINGYDDDDDDDDDEWKITIPLLFTVETVTTHKVCLSL